MKNLLNFSFLLFSYLFVLGILPQSSLAQDLAEEQIHEPSPEAKTSLFDYIYQMEGQPKIVIETNLRSLIAKKMKENYQGASFQLMDEEGTAILDLGGRIRARGNVRKKVSYFPPVKVDFKKSVLDSLGFLKLDKLKFVFPTNGKKQSQRRLCKEFFLYELYEQLGFGCIRTKLVDISIVQDGEEKEHFTGFLIEDEEEYSRRNNAIIVEKGKLRASALDRESFLKMVFFQYMIANTDYSVGSKHNLEIVKFPTVKRVVAVPYDFDYSGFVGQDYAIPNDHYPIKSIHERYLFPSYRITEAEYHKMVDYFLSIEQEVYAFCEQATYMEKKVIKDNKAYLKVFFDQLRRPRKLKYNLVKNN